MPRATTATSFMKDGWIISTDDLKQNIIVSHFCIVVVARPGSRGGDRRRRRPRRNPLLITPA